jgi:ATPase subunit of ABC transporter with duplicated ATPase domains
MTLITLRNFGVTLGTPLFSELDLVVNAGDRIGLVAANGRGKTTLLRCIAGAMEASEGEITRSRGLTLGYVEQNVPEALMDLPVHAAVLDALSPDQQLSESWRVDVALEQLEVPEPLRGMALKQLSGGWQRHHRRFWDCRAAALHGERASRAQARAAGRNHDLADVLAVDARR